MRSIILIVLIGLSTAPAFGQFESKERSIELRKTEIHGGLSTHKLIHFGVRQYLGWNVMLEADLGAVPGIDRVAYSYNLGLGGLINSTLYEPNLYFSLNYTMIAIQYRREQHLFAGNIGFLSQHDIISVLARAGVILFGNHDWFPYNLEVTLGVTF